MKITGIICEYNPLHRGHCKQFDTIRRQSPGGGIVCLMSGNFVQRGAPAIFDKMLRAEAAVRCGADLVLELPVTAALSSAEGFAAAGVGILNGICDTLSFGAENADDRLFRIAQALLSEEFPVMLRKELDKGCSFPAARQQALCAMGIDSSILSTPNNILAVEYCKAIISSNASITPSPIQRSGDYHAREADYENPSATAVRQTIYNREDWQHLIPDAAKEVFANAAVHELSCGQRAMLARLRTMSEQDFASLPYGSEGLWRRLMKNARSLSSIEDILTSTKSKRYTRSRLDRMLLCAFLQLTETDIQTPAPYIRVLAFNDKGRSILAKAKEYSEFINIGEKVEHPYQIIENRCDDLYGLFSSGEPEPPGYGAKQRVFYYKDC